MKSLPEGMTFRFCVPCNRRGAAHVAGRCTMAHTHPPVAVHRAAK